MSVMWLRVSGESAQGDDRVVFIRYEAADAVPDQEPPGDVVHVARLTFVDPYMRKAG